MFLKADFSLKTFSVFFDLILFYSGLNFTMASTSECRPSKIFEGYKALGFVTNHVPFIIRYVQKLDDLRIVTCVGRSFHSYNSRLRLLETSKYIVVITL